MSFTRATTTDECSHVTARGRLKCSFNGYSIIREGRYAPTRSATTLTLSIGRSAPIYMGKSSTLTRGSPPSILQTLTIRGPRLTCPAFEGQDDHWQHSPTAPRLRERACCPARGLLLQTPADDDAKKMHRGCQTSIVPPGRAQHCRHRRRLPRPATLRARARAPYALQPECADVAHFEETIYSANKVLRRDTASLSSGVVKLSAISTAPARSPDATRRLS